MSQGQSSIDDRSGKADAPHSGKLLRELIRGGKSFSGRERHCCYLNTGDGPFANVSALSGLDLQDDGRAIAQVDWDHDGDLDYWIVNRSGPQVRFMRNTLGNENGYLALLLQGTACNRDAIGARVTVELTEARRRVLSKSVRAGDGYLSQSSKWLHFGLGPSPRIKVVRVRWPGGVLETFEHLAPNQRYTIKQGDGQAMVWRKPARRPKRSPSPEPSASSPATRIVLTSPSLVPSLEYQSPTGRSKTLFAGRNPTQPMLLSLWASWCQPCLQELALLTEHQDQLNNVELRVLALNVDEISGNEAAVKDPYEILRRMGFPFDTGSATAKLLDQLQTLHDSLFDLHETLPLPCSLLIDRDGRLAVLYKGPLDLDRVAIDVRQLDVHGTRRRELAIPFEGRWSSGIRSQRQLMVALKMLEQGWLDETLSYVQRQQSPIARDPEIHVLLFNIGQEFTRRGEHSQAMRFYRQALARKPDLGAAHYNLAVTLALANQPDSALPHFREAVEAEPSNVRHRIGLATTLVRLGRLSEAIDALREALREDPSHAEANYELAIALVWRGRFEEGVRHYQQAIDANGTEFTKEARFERFERAATLLANALTSRGARGIEQAEKIRHRMSELRDLRTAP